MATSLDKDQITSSRIKRQKTCIHHKALKESRLDFYCKDCQQLACINCLSSVHVGHRSCSLNDNIFISQKKDDLEKFIDRAENVDLLRLSQNITSTDTHLKDNARNFENLSHRLTTQTNKLKQDLDLITAHALSYYQQMEKDNTKLLQTYKENLEMYSTQLNEQIQECKRVLQGGSNIHIYDAVCEIHSRVILPETPTLEIASFTPNTIPQIYLEEALGLVDIQSTQRLDLTLSSYTISSESQGAARFSHDSSTEGHGRSVGWSAILGPLSTQQQSDDPKVRTPSTQQRCPVSSPVYTLLQQTKVLGGWDSPCYITSVCPTTDGQIWTSYSGSTTSTLLDRKGNVIQEVKHSTKIMDISLSPTTNTLWACDEDKSITELVSGRLVHRFSTIEYPLCICITASNHVIVGMEDHISKFTTQGEMVLTTMAAGTGKTLLYSPMGISECPVTHNVAVAVVDWDGKGDGVGDWKSHVVVMDSDFEELFLYDGEVPNTYQPTSHSGDSFYAFYPSCGVVFDSVGNLVIGDRFNKRVLLVSGCGEFLRLIHTDDDDLACAVGVDREDVLFAVFDKARVKLLKFSCLSMCMYI